ncbi:uncharacterized protein [Pseudochaenichthys georgianus]|uniref:uncharacterized protein isoform X2 n=1 Tax=Pseudochaenichthys georgianus TaxID=52239 RepID=UPI00146BA1BE|nr:uncharacterized protein LOC117459823 isoform X2 [Pseudochaenichthys georgianus]
MMGTPVILKIIVTDCSSQRLTLPHGLPVSVDDLKDEVKKQCGLEGNFRLQFMDSLFGNEFLNLTSMTEVVDKGTLRVCDVSRPTDILNDHERSAVAVLNPQIAYALNDSSSLSSGYVDTDVQSIESTSTRSSWPAVFHVPKFSYDVELKLQQEGLTYVQNGTVLMPEPKLKSAILDGLVQEIVNSEMEEVAQSLIKTHPCSSEKRSCTGCGRWKTSLKYKLSNYRTHLRKQQKSDSELLKKQTCGKEKCSFWRQKGKESRGEFCPTYPIAETEESLEAMQRALLLDAKKRNNRDIVKLKMEKTFALRRHEVVRDGPMVEDFMARWPALFEVSEINSEFKRITTKPLQSKCLSQLDLHSGTLMKLFQKRGGQLGGRLETIILQMANAPSRTRLWGFMFLKMLPLMNRRTSGSF